MSNVDDSRALNDALSSKDDSPISYVQPKGFIDAVSEIQRYYVMEKDTEKEIDSNFFALNQVFDFLWIGVKNGLLESFLFASLLPLLQLIYPSFSFYFLGEQLTKNEMLMVNLIAYTPLVLFTIYLCNLARFNNTVIAKKATVSLITGRSIAFFVKGVIIYYLFAYIFKLAMTEPESVYSVIEFVKTTVDFIAWNDYTYTTADLFHYSYLYVIPALDQTSINVLISMSIFAFIPYSLIVIAGMYKSYRKIKNKADYENY